MKRLVLCTLIACCMATPVMAVQITPNDPWNPVTGAEKNLYQIWNENYGSGSSWGLENYNSSADLVNGFRGRYYQQTWDVSPVDISFVVKYAGNNHEFGVYHNNPIVHEHLETNNFGSVTHSPGGMPFGFYIRNTNDSGIQPGVYRYSEHNLNYKNKQQMWAIFVGKEVVGNQFKHTWLLAFEDLDWRAKDKKCKPLWDYDYNDYVVELSYMTPIPEPATLALLGMGLAGLGARRRLFSQRK